MYIMNDELDIFYSVRWIERTDKFHFSTICNIFDEHDVIEVEFYKYRKFWFKWDVTDILTFSIHEIEMYEYYFILDQIRLILKKDCIKDIKKFIKYG